MSEEFDLTNMTRDDLFRAKEERRKRMANLPFEEKIAIVKKLQQVSRTLKSVREANQERAAGKVEIRIKTK